MEIEIYELPTHWASALINGDLSGYDSDDLEAIRRFADDMIRRYGKCWCLDVSDDEGNFVKYHDASQYGVLACDVAEFSFDVTKED